MAVLQPSIAKLEYDALIIGARVPGATLAALLGDAGRRRAACRIEPTICPLTTEQTPSLMYFLTKSAERWPVWGMIGCLFTKTP